MVAIQIWSPSDRSAIGFNSTLGHTPRLRPTSARPKREQSARGETD